MGELGFSEPRLCVQVKSGRSLNERTFFEIQLWDADDLVQRLLNVHDNLPLEIRRDIPLESRLMPVELTPPS